ncbi:MAG: protein kinase [Pirellulales bacterium]
MTDVMKCPEDAQWEKILSSTNSDESEATAAHLEHCAACRATVERLAAGSLPWKHVARQIQAGQASAAAPPPLAKVVQRLLQQPNAAMEAGVAAVSPDLPRHWFAPPKQPGQIGCLQDYEILEEVGRGAMGIVYRAFDPKLHRVVAIKVMSPHLATYPLARQRFVREGHSVAAVCHENVVAVHAVGEVEDVPFLVMQYVAGKTLQQRIEQRGPGSVADILRIGMQAAAGLAAAHAQGLVHRDIKPANLLLENGVERVKLTDFGLARAVDDASLTQTGVISGTPQYMSPEQAHGEPVDARSDLFSLGGVLYALCTGRPPFRGSSTPAVLRRVCESEPTPVRELNPEIPDWLANLVMKLLAKQPAERIATARELSELLGVCLEHWQQPGRTPLPAAVESLGRLSKAPTGPTKRRESAYAWLKTPLGILLLLAALLFPLSRLNRLVDRWLGPNPTTLPATTSHRESPPPPDLAPAASPSLVGLWKVVSIDASGRQAPSEIIEALQFRFEQDDLDIIPGEPGFTRFRYQLDMTTSPAHIDLIHTEGESQGKTLRGLWRIEHGALQISLGDNDRRPTGFRDESAAATYVLTRMTEEKKPSEALRH